GADEKARRDHAFLADELANGADEPTLNDGPGQAHNGENVHDRASGGPEAVKRQEREGRLQGRQRERRQEGHHVEPRGVGLERLQAGDALLGTGLFFGAERFGEHPPDDQERCERQRRRNEKRQPDGRIPEDAPYERTKDRPETEGGSENSHSFGPL